MTNIETQKCIRYGIRGTNLKRTILKVSLLAAIFAALGTAGAVADEATQGRNSKVVDAPSNLGQIESQGVSHTSSTCEGEAVGQRSEGKSAIAAYTPSYRTGLRWKK